MIELLCTDYNKKATSIHYYFGNAVIVAGLEPVAGEHLPYALERLGSPAQRHHARKSVSSVKAQIVLIQPGHDFGIMVAADKADGLLFGDFPYRELRATLARSGVIPVLAHSSYPPGGLS